MAIQEDKANKTLCIYTELTLAARPLGGGGIHSATLISSCNHFSLFQVQILLTWISVQHCHPEASTIQHFCLGRCSGTNI